MQIGLRTVCTFLAVIGLSSGEEYAGAKKVNHEQFTNLLEGTDPVVVKFYAPWCGHCQEFAPHYQMVAAKFHQSAESTVKFVTVDVTVETALKEKYDITAFPQVRLMLDGGKEVVNYEGDRSEADLAEFVNVFTSEIAILRRARADAADF